MNNSFYFMVSLCSTLVLSNSLFEHEKIRNHLKKHSIPEENHHNASFNNHDKRIRSGETIDITQAKYYVYMKCSGTQCGGTLVRRNKVITAAHCVMDCHVNDFTIAVGLNSIYEYNSARKYRASSIVMHPNYNRQAKFPYDIAVVTLTQDVELNNRVDLINYATSLPPVGNFVTVVGYGMIDGLKEGPTSIKLQRANLKVIYYKQTCFYTEVVGPRGPTILPGDSGGPAVYNGLLTGVVSGYFWTNQNIIYQNAFAGIGDPQILNFIRRYAP
nr:chymotrypsin-2-like [Onthophagus taurus]